MDKPQITDPNYYAYPRTINKPKNKEQPQPEPSKNPQSELNNK